jgi:hypothetical protein
MIVDLTVSGWIPKSSKIEKLYETLKKLNLTRNDTVVIDPMSNTAYPYTDEDGHAYTCSKIRRGLVVPSDWRPPTAPPPPLPSNHA